jgi:hypothetical protein
METAATEVLPSLEADRRQRGREVGLATTGRCPF